MSRLIDADKLKAHYSWWKGGGREMTMDEAKNDFDTIVDLQPTIDPTKHGRWKGAGMGDYMCSLCATVVSGNRYHYCPKCGARMDAQIGEDKSHPFAESVMMGMDEVEEC